MTALQVLSSLLAPDAERERIYGVVVALVTNINDPDKQGRVKLRFPWLGDAIDSPWARVAAPMAGAKRGVYMLPEIDDEVLVAFEHGLPERPYVVGYLWNGKDAPPVQAVEGDKVALRAIKTRAGHTIEFREDKDAQHKGHIRIATAGGHSILLSDDDGKLEIKSGKHAITMDDKGQKLTISAQGSLEISCAGCKLSFSQDGLELSQQANKLTFGSAGGKLEAVPELTVKGGKLKLNPPG